MGRGNGNAWREGRTLPVMDDRPIGMFDSGFGGLTVARAVIDLLPAERLVYVGDTGRYPYGPRPLGQVRGVDKVASAMGIAGPVSVFFGQYRSTWT